MNPGVPIAQEEETVRQYAEWSARLDADPFWRFRRSGNGGTLLHDAAEDEQPAFASRLLHLGLDVNARDFVGRTPLHRAARSGSVVMIDLLIGSGADPRCRDLRGDTPVRQGWFSIRGNGIETVEALLSRGADLDLNTAYEMGRRDYVTRRMFCNPAAFRETPSPNDLLTLAVLRQDWELVRVFLSAGADLNGRTSVGLTPLIVACSNEATPYEEVQFLLESGADFRVAHGRTGEDALSAAEEIGRRDLVELMRSYRRAD